MLLLRARRPEPELKPGLDLDLVAILKKMLHLKDQSVPDLRSKPLLQMLKRVEMEHDRVSPRSRLRPDNVHLSMAFRLPCDRDDLAEPSLVLLVLSRYDGVPNHGDHH